MIPQYQSVTGAPAQPPPAVNENIQGSDLRPKHSVVQGGHQVFFQGLEMAFRLIRQRREQRRVAKLEEIFQVEIK